MHEIGIKELKARASAIVRDVRQSKTRYVVTYRGRPSVFINAFNPYEEGYEDSHRRLAAMQERGIPVILPTLVLPEVAATIARGRDDTELGQRFADALSRLAHLYLVPLDKTTARQASEIAAVYRLRGADAVYSHSDDDLWRESGW